ncbi:uncharacterized protein T551_02141 [Pneumocystis jirovecii RU7]|uniref:VPS9 domain-containing protein n=1 Tax=Pneumocystis jirovecii (strain RU7) TaxID=1408657 RepID=A0A0W4ZMB6_PNEJ7|nr:uncharacterized protein T551_02141 [Pneumocystis jirovecii RU7]KTW29525.1 hypothetical protein T551_02141 [Pneumocystis jirovecii RU7]
MKEIRRALNNKKENDRMSLSDQEIFLGGFHQYNLSKHQKCLERSPSIKTEKTHILGTFSLLVDAECLDAPYSGLNEKKDLDLNVISQKQFVQQTLSNNVKNGVKDSEKDEKVEDCLVHDIEKVLLFEKDLKKTTKENTFENTLIGFKLPELKLVQTLDFHKFLGQLRYKSAIPITKYMKSFIYEFLQRHWTIREKVKIIRDFLDFIYQKMLLVEPWINTSEAEFDNAKDGMEKLIMTRLYDHTFSPAITYLLDDDISGHSDDLERDRILREKISMFAWIKEEHMEIPHSDLNQKFLYLAGQELMKVNAYHSPRDKVICILNCSKVIFGLLKHAGIEESADKFIPILIFVILKTNPGNIISNIQYISRFRNPEKLSGESGYYFSSLIGAIAFIENLDKSSLTISDEEFEKNLENAIIEVNEQKNKEAVEKSKDNHSISSSILKPTKEYIVSKSSNAFRNIQKPFSSLGKIFIDQNTEQSYQSNFSKQFFFNQSSRNMASETVLNKNKLIYPKINAQYPGSKFVATKDVQVQVKLETLNTLNQMFPAVDLDVIKMVVDFENGKLDSAIDVLLSISSGT